MTIDLGNRSVWIKTICGKVRKKQVQLFIKSVITLGSKLAVSVVQGPRRQPAYVHLRPQPVRSSSRRGAGGIFLLWYSTGPSLDEVGTLIT